MPKRPWTPYAMLSLFEIGILITGFSESGIRGLWLTAFDKSGLFRCQSGIRWLWLEAFDKSGLFRCQSGIRWLWLEAFDRSGFFWCQSRSFRPTLLPPLQSVFAKDTAFLSAKAQKLQNSAKPNSGTVCRIFYGGILVWLSIGRPVSGE